MGSENRSFPAQLNLLWARLNSSEKLIVVASALILITALVIWIGMARQPAYALLYGNLEAADAGRVVSELQAENVKYQIKDGGKSIHVPADKVDELRISLASGGFVPTATTGYEILDRSPFGVSDRTQRVKTTQALEGELARTLMSLREVSAARVHLTLPQPSPFISEKVDPAASVVLNVVPPGTTLSRENIGAVRTFVAGAIGGKPDNVTIIDQNMNLLTGPTDEQPGGLLPSQEEARRNYELQKTAAIRSLLEPVYGFGKVAVSFSCEMDFDQVQTESLDYEPVSGTDHGALVSEERTEDSVSGEGYTAPVGVPGTESNIPSYVGTTGKPYKSDSSTETKNYESSSTHETRIQAPGTVKHSSVGVLIDSTGRPQDDIGQTEVTTVKQLVTDGAGLSVDTGDTLTVAFKPFDTSLKDELAASQAKVGASEVWALVLRFGLAFAVLMIFYIVLRQFFRPIEKTFVVPAAPPEIEERIPVDLPVVDPATLEKIRMREEIERLIREDPAAASKVIKTWLKE